MATSAAATVWRPTLPVNPVRATAAGKVAALLVLACVAAHIPVLLTHLPHFPGTSLLMLALSCACLFCVGHLWTKPTIRDWSTTGALAAGMLVLHAMMMVSMTNTLTGAANTATPGHRHRSAPHTMDAAPTPSGTLELLFYGASALALIQVFLAVVIVLPTMLRSRSQRTAV
ncbi:MULTISPECIES: hypothetical protein [Rhodococcus]|uniref:hypothetical protein n=1 Tax=Rhodococcus TaxID=1827 RepID=UPI000EA9567D|nr:MULTISPECIES: hypothetical protein [Rhodococcus]MDI9938659.1 hypothetical protein [Rhodococcus sp. IEGM 1351]MDJ0420692.1 hypothetical protein [Rhodococcus opacus]QZS56732.1 hypothetical protein FXW36_06390 [Rhodococcus opacus]RKM76647.1 hypothetical protein COO55_34805 [Rhodococcus opacus]UNN01267.1 hypothetical protein MOO23_01615 [Rhodococcus opacus]